MATQPPSLADDLKSLRIDRAPANRGLPGWVTPPIVIAAVVAAGLVAWRAVGDRLFAPEVDTTTVALVTPAQGAQLQATIFAVVMGLLGGSFPAGRAARLPIAEATKG